MILCCKTCGNCFETDDMNERCDYCNSGKVEVLFTDEEITSIARDELQTLINVSREKYKVNNDEYDISLWSSREHKESTERAKNNALKRRIMVETYMLTTGFSFEGYSISEYKGVISGQVVLGTGFLSEFTASFSDLFGTQSNQFSNKLEQAKDAAIQQLVKKSIEKGGNAIIGVDFDYITFANNMIGVVANGTSVIIEKAK